VGRGVDGAEVREDGACPASFEIIVGGEPHSVREIAFVAPIMFKRRSDVPSYLSMLTKGGTSFGTNVGDNFGARGSNGCPIKIVVAKE
jgi:hypothetical protein